MLQRKPGLDLPQREVPPGRPGNSARGAAPKAMAPPTQASFLQLVWLYAFLAIALIGTSPFQELVMSNENSSGDIVNQVLIVSLFLLLATSGGVRLNWKQVWPLPLSMSVLLAYCALSTSWAVAPLISGRRVVATALIIWIIFRLARDLGYARMVHYMRYFLVALVAINLLVVAVTPFGVQPYDPADPSIAGDWRGLMGNKNIAGATCAFTILFLLYDQRSFPRLLTLAGIAGAALFLYFSHSRTAGLALVIAAMLALPVRYYDPRYRVPILIALSAVGFILGIILLANVGRLEQILSDPGSFTGRTQIWPLLIEYASKHPWTGAGFGSFWQIGYESPIWTLTRNWIARYASHGHNGYLDLVVTIGIPGAILAMVAIFVSPLIRLFAQSRMPRAQRALLFGSVVFAAVHNLGESSLMNGSTPVEVFLMSAVAMIASSGITVPGLRQRMMGMIGRRSDLPPMPGVRPAA